MGKHQMKFDREVVEVEIPDSDLLGILRSREVPCAPTEEEFACPRTAWAMSWAI